MTESPRVTVIVPCRNEARYIGPCLDSILATAYPLDRLEILVVDGQSTDNTREIVREYAEKHAVIRLLDNPLAIVPTALNIGVQAASGEIIARMDAHVVYPPEYLPRLVLGLQEHHADNVGACMVTLPADGTATAQAIAIALSHPFGVGNAHFRIGARTAREVDTVPFGCYPRDVFKRVGMFDEEMIRNQDDEFNNRIIRKGGRVMLIPDVVCYYYARGSFAKVARMFYQYGAFKPLAARKSGRIMTLRQLIPAMFVTGLGVSLLGALVSSRAAVTAAAIASAYALSVLGCALLVAKKHGFRCAVAIAGVFPVLHTSYGVGFLRGLCDGLLGRRGRWRDPAVLRLSR
ncbi:MAG TPA: glycosyltransferase family 2 protein [Gemmatimonadales bacterium]|nr:glycosyltransferase family 2 protein [Gemmatimonadales bacterium]